uniref:Ion transport domain-containing protein n=1 Tax=Phaeomonas parva TaxID=124430 RepID=A0A6U4FC96_9STRA|mmetsp:Transcript_25043/g.78481  ORF Transcript_25043/g.78481 Transcript_25043/m.78481 type:complete len:740 (+) Transcript_25043:660-2879(+)
MKNSTPFPPVFLSCTCCSGWKLVAEALFVVVLLADAALTRREERSLYAQAGVEQHSGSHKETVRVQQTWQVVLALLVLDVATRMLTRLPWSAVLRPWSLYALDPAVRDGSKNVATMLPMAFAIVGMELYLALVFACACVAFFGTVPDSGFNELSDGFVNLFALSTTVNDPDVWLPLYAQNRWNCLPFVVFLVAFLFLLHNFIIAFIYERFSRAVQVTIEKRRQDRMVSLDLAFRVLDTDMGGVVPKKASVALLEHMFPSYGPGAIAILFEYLDTNGEGALSRSEFCRIESCLNLHVYEKVNPRAVNRPPRVHADEIRESMGAVAWDGVAIVNATSVIYASIVGADFMATQTIHLLWFSLGLLSMAEFITHVQGATSLRFFFESQWNVLHAISLVLVVLALVIPDEGSTAHKFFTFSWETAGTFTVPSATSLLVVSRCMDMVRCLCRIPWYQKTIDALGSVVPYVASQCIVLFVLSHFFAFVGMFIWGGTIHKDTPFPGSSGPYYMCNFNSYADALVVLFELLVVNNWHIIATGFVSVSGHVAYIYFVVFNVVAVTVGLNIMTALFISVAMYGVQNDADVRQTLSTYAPKDPDAVGASEVAGNGLCSVHAVSAQLDKSTFFMRAFDTDELSTTSILRAAGVLCGTKMCIYQLVDKNTLSMLYEADDFTDALAPLLSVHDLLIELSGELRALERDGGSTKKIARKLVPVRIRGAERTLEAAAHTVQAFPRFIMCSVSGLDA